MIPPPSASEVSLLSPASVGPKVFRSCRDPETAQYLEPRGYLGMAVRRQQCGGRSSRPASLAGDSRMG